MKVSELLKLMSSKQVVDIYTFGEHIGIYTLYWGTVAECPDNIKDLTIDCVAPSVTQEPVNGYGVLLISVE